MYFNSAKIALASTKAKKIVEDRGLQQLTDTKQLEEIIQDFHLYKMSWIYYHQFSRMKK